MALNVVHDTVDDIPEQYRDLYSEQDGKFVLSGISGVKTQADIDRQQAALAEERTAHKATKARFHPFAELDQEDVFKKLDRYDELEAAANDKLDDGKIDEIVEKRIKTRLAPVERNLGLVTKERDELANENTGFKEQSKMRKVSDHVRAALIKAKVLDTAHEDALLLADRMFDVTEDGTVLTKDNVGVTPGVDADVWLTEMQPKRTHWWPQSVTGGARGSGSNSGFAGNPWTAENWNVTKQGGVIREHGREKADQLAKSAGSYVGATKPAAKT